MLTSAHATPELGRRVDLLVLAEGATVTGVVVWRGTAGGGDDGALVEVDDPAWRPPAGPGLRWGRVVTNRPGIAGQAWGFPKWAQRPERAMEAWQPSGTLNPGNRYVGDRYVLSLSMYPPASTGEESSPWEGLSGAALFCGDLLTGVIAADPAGGQHAYLEAVPVYMLHRDPVFRQVLARYGAAAAESEPVELQHLTETELPLTRSPAALLRARQQVVAFRGRTQILDQLEAWAQGSGFAAWLVHAPAGQGKTRLAQELARRLAEHRWATVWLRGDATDGLDVLADVAVPLLLIVDYAETRTGASGDADRAAHLTAVLRTCARHGGQAPLRVLLLARTAGDWWAQLQSSDPQAEDLLAGTPTTGLPALEPEAAGRIDAYRQAAADLARQLPRLPGHGGGDWETIAARLPAPTLATGMTTALTLHMTALADLLDAADRPDATATPDQPTHRPAGGAVEDRLLGHERRYWAAAARTAGLLPGLSEVTLHDALAAAFLLGAADWDTADATRTRPRLNAAPAGPQHRPGSRRHADQSRWR